MEDRQVRNQEVVVGPGTSGGLTRGVPWKVAGPESQVEGVGLEPLGDASLRKGVETQEKASSRSKEVETRNYLEGRRIGAKSRSSDQRSWKVVWSDPRKVGEPEPNKDVGPVPWKVAGLGQRSSRTGGLTSGIPRKIVKSVPDWKARWESSSWTTRSGRPKERRRGERGDSSRRKSTETRAMNRPTGRTSVIGRSSDRKPLVVRTTGRSSCQILVEVVVPDPGEGRRTGAMEGHRIAAGARASCNEGDD